MLSQLYLPAFLVGASRVLTLMTPLELVVMLVTLVPLGAYLPVLGSYAC
jgi:hypothetical protein